MGTIRIAVLGDSFVDALQVMLEERITEILEGDLGVEVLNFGLEGSGTDIQLLRWRSIVRQYEPDLVILVFFEGNDVSEVYGNSHPGIEPHFVLNGGILRLVNAGEVQAQYEQEVRWGRSRLFLARFLRNAQLTLWSAPWALRNTSALSAGDGSASHLTAIACHQAAKSR